MSEFQWPTSWVQFCDAWEEGCYHFEWEALDKFIQIGWVPPHLPYRLFLQGAVSTAWALLFEARQSRAGKAHRVSCPIWHRICAFIMAARSVPFIANWPDRRRERGLTPWGSPYPSAFKVMPLGYASHFLCSSLCTGSIATVCSPSCWRLEETHFIIRTGERLPFHSFLRFQKHPFKCYCVYGKTNSGKVTMGPVPVDRFTFLI